MVLGYYTSVFLLYVVPVFTSIRPVPLQIIVNQSPHREDVGVITDLVNQGDCIDMRYNNVESRIQLTKPNYNRDSFTIELFSSRCDVDSPTLIANRTLPTSGEVFVNTRKPICSYKLDTPESSQVSVSFHYGTTNLTKGQSANGGDCTRRCSDGETSSNYPHSVYFTRNGNPVRRNNGIHLFSDTECIDSIGHLPVVDPQESNNLVESTSTNVQAKSFRIWNNVGLRK